MLNNDARFEKLIGRIGGRQQVVGHVSTEPGLKTLERMHVVPEDPNVTRILGELEFALKLDKYDENSGMYSKLIEKALDVLEDALDLEHALSVDACAAAEKELLPMSSDAKEYEAIIVGHAHIDMNWMWSYNETVAVTLATFTTMCDLMDQYPEFTFAQSQASVYRIVEEHDPELMERILEYIREGRWEVTAGAWVETDKNMPAGESLLNTVEYTRKYMSEVWGVDPAALDLDFSPDTFGHSRHVPEINCYEGLKYYYQCRGCDESYVLYRYKAPSGSEILVYGEPYWYNSAISPHIGIGLPELSRKMGGMKTGLIVYGVGDHGGGATRRDIETALEIQTWPVFPRVRFGTFHDFFRLADTPEVRANLPVVEHELNFVFDGCYTTQSRIKRANRYTEAKLLEAQEFSALAAVYDSKFRYNYKGFEKAWQDTCFTHFHDILTGSCVQDSREYAMGLYQKALAVAETEENKALRAIAGNIDTLPVVTALREKLEDGEADPLDGEDFPYGAISEGAGVGFGLAAGIPNPERGRGKTRFYNIFNPAQIPVETNVEITVWDWPGKLPNACFTGADGEPLEFVPLSGDFEWYWNHFFMRFLVRVKLPAFGYTTVVLKEKVTQQYPFNSFYGDWGRLQYENECVLENKYIRAEFDPVTMQLKSLVDKADGAEKLDPDGFSGLAVVDTQDNGMTAWLIGRYLKKTPVTNLVRANRFANGGLRQGYSFHVKMLGSAADCTVFLDADSRYLQFNYTVDWNERSGETLPVLTFELALKHKAKQYLCDVPMGTTLRSGANHDIPCLSFCAALPAGESIGANSVVLRSDCKYGYRLFGGDLALTLINTAHNPDPLPERFIHTLTVYVGIEPVDPLGYYLTSEKLAHVPKAIPVNPHTGTLPPSGTLFEAAPGTAFMSSLTMSAEGRLRPRIVELKGLQTEAVFRIGDSETVITAEPYSIAHGEL